MTSHAVNFGERDIDYKIMCFLRKPLNELEIWKIYRNSYKK